MLTYKAVSIKYIFSLKKNTVRSYEGPFWNLKAPKSNLLQKIYIMDWTECVRFMSARHITLFESAPYRMPDTGSI